MRKLDIKKIVEAMKPVKVIKKAPDSPSITKVKEQGIRVRDMRQEAIDIGSHGASDYFQEEGVSNQ